MTHDEMIAVIQAKKAGKQILCRGRCGGIWFDFSGDLFDFVNFEHRVKSLPVPPGDLTWEEAKKLHEEGVKVVRLSVCADSCCWVLAAADCFTSSDKKWKNQTAYRRAPVTRKVPLGPEDVPPGSVIRHNQNTMHWSLVTCVKEKGVYCGHTVELIGFEWMMTSFEIKRPGQDWQLCEKDEVEQ